VKFFAGLMNRINDPAEQQQITHAANMFFFLYGNIFHAMTPAHGLPALSAGTGE
jgi:ABC-type nickel/cobalt efflux system permease component RcnA